MIEPLISVIIPCYKIERRFNIFLQALKSVELQTYSNWELLVVDDCSPDNSSKLLTSAITHLGPKAKYLRLETNRGVSIARNLGINNANGEIVSFLDFDDIYLPNFLKSVSEAINNTYDWAIANTLFLKTWSGMFRVSTGHLRDNINQISFPEFQAEILYRNFPVAMGSAIACKKSIFEKNSSALFDEYLSKKTAEDVYFGYNLLALNYRPYVILEPQVIHRTFCGEISRSINAFLKVNEEDVYNYIYQHAMKTIHERIHNTEIIDKIDSRIEKTKLEFSLKNKFLKNGFLSTIPIILNSKLEFKTWIRLVLIKISKYFPFSSMRNAYFFWTAPNNSMLKEVALGTLKNLKT